MTTQPPPASTIKLSPVEAADFEALLALRIEAMCESLERIGRFDPARARERFRTTFDPQATRHIQVGAACVGFVAIQRGDAHIVLDHLYIRPGHQGQGVGAGVLQWVFDQADTLRLPVRVGALRESDSNRFYLRHGFRLVEQSEFDNYYLRPCNLP
jgi:GNAT superfamily N-acetyltransferase